VTRVYELPAIRIGHLHTKATATEYGMKGMSEGGAVIPPAAIANAVRDALAPLGVEINQTPLTSQRVLTAIRKCQSEIPVSYRAPKRMTFLSSFLQNMSLGRQGAGIRGTADSLV